MKEMAILQDVVMLDKRDNDLVGPFLQFVLFTHAPNPLLTFSAIKGRQDDELNKNLVLSPTICITFTCSELHFPNL
jgi:hypothetical protein